MDAHRSCCGRSACHALLERKRVACNVTANALAGGCSPAGKLQHHLCSVCFGMCAQLRAASSRACVCLCNHLRMTAAHSARLQILQDVDMLWCNSIRFCAQGSAAHGCCTITIRHRDQQLPGVSPSCIFDNKSSIHISQGDSEPVLQSTLRRL